MARNLLFEPFLLTPPAPADMPLPFISWKFWGSRLVLFQRLELSSDLVGGSPGGSLVPSESMGF